MHATLRSGCGAGASVQGSSEKGRREVQSDAQYCVTPDGVRLAYCVMGNGMPLVRTPHWFAHLDNDLKSPIFRYQILSMSHRHRLLRYDGRGLGLSQRDVPPLTFEQIVQDFETVVDRAGFERFALVGLSQGGATAITYASRHPERVSHLILFGAFARGALHRDDAERQKFEIGRSLILQGWGSDEDSYREFFTSAFIPDGTIDDHRSLNHIQRVSAEPKVAAEIFDVNANINVVDLLPTVKVPTLVMHPRGDLRVPFSLGQEIAAGIPNSKFVPLDTRNHMLLPNEPAARQFFETFSAFLGDAPFRGALPGTARAVDRVEATVAAVERNWFIKVIIILAAITGVVIFFMEMWKLAAHR